MSSVLLCSHNDAIGKVAVMFAALGVFGTGSNWPVTETSPVKELQEE
jgi:hypothetical protein